MRNKKRLNYLAVLLAVNVLLKSIPACETTPKIEYIHEIPDVTFPVFPIPDSVIYDEETDTVSMPLWYWQKIVEYKIDVDAIETYIKGLRGINNGVDK